MKINKFIKPLMVTVAAVMTVGFLLLLVDESTITGKVTANSGGAVASSFGINLSIFLVFVFVIIAFLGIIIFKKDKFFLKK